MAFARDSALVPLCCPASPVSVAARQTDQQHLAACATKNTACPRCKFEAGFAGRLRQGSTKFCTPRPDLAYKNNFTFALDGSQQPWITVRPESWPGPFATGCWLCNKYRDTVGKNQFSDVACPPGSIYSTSIFRKHAEGASHTRALELHLSSTGGGGQAPDAATTAPVVVTGATNTTPRIDRFVLALNCVSRYASYADFASFVRCMAVGSALSQGSGAKSDCSAQAMQKMTFAMCEPLRERDRVVLRSATHVALACDERDSIMLVHLRVVLRRPSSAGGWRSPSLYECVLGPTRDFGTGWRACRTAVRDALRDACLERRGRRGDDRTTGSADTVDEELFLHLRQVVRVAVADGGPDIQKAIFRSSPLGGEADPLFPNLTITTRDRAHRLRSIQRNTWDAMHDTADGMLSSLITGERSLARMLETSRKYSLVWERAQTTLRAHDAESPHLFARTLRNLSFNDARFDSRSRPLTIALSTLPVIISTLHLLLLDGDDDDKKWARELLEQLSGREGFRRHGRSFRSVVAVRSSSSNRSRSSSCCCSGRRSRDVE